MREMKRNNDPTKLSCRIGERWDDFFIGREFDNRYGHRLGTHIMPYGDTGDLQMVTEHTVIDTWCNNRVVFNECVSGEFVGNIAKVAVTMPMGVSCRIMTEMDIASGTFECGRKLVG